MEDLTPQLVRRAVAGDRDAVGVVVARLTPVIQARVARLLLRRQGAARGRDVRQEVADLTQDVFEVLLADGGRRLLAWTPERGSPMAFFGLIAERQAGKRLDSRRRSPWSEDPVEPGGIDEQAPESLPARLASRDALRRLGERLLAGLNERDLQLFRLLYVEQLDDEAVREALGIGRDALYQARSRLRQRLQALSGDLVEGGA